MDKGQEKTGNFLTRSLKTMTDAVSKAQGEVAEATKSLQKEGSNIDLRPVVRALGAIEDRLDEPLRVIDDPLAG